MDWIGLAQDSDRWHALVNMLGPKAGGYSDNNNLCKTKINIFMPLQLFKLYSIT